MTIVLGEPRAFGVAHIGLASPCATGSTAVLYYTLRATEKLFGSEPFVLALMQNNSSCAAELCVYKLPARVRIALELQSMRVQGSFAQCHALLVAFCQRVSCVCVVTCWDRQGGMLRCTSGRLAVLNRACGYMVEQPCTLVGQYRLFIQYRQYTIELPRVHVPCAFLRFEISPPASSSCAYRTFPLSP